MESFDESDLRKRKLNHLEDTSDGNAAHSNIATGAWIPPLGPRNPPLLNGAGKPPQGPYASPFAQLTSSAFSSPFVARPASETFEPARSKPPHQRSSAFGVTHAPTPLPKMPVTPFVDLTLEHHASRQRTPHAPYHPPSTSMYSPYYRSPSTSLPTTPAPAPPSVPYSSSPAMSQYREPAQTASTTGTGTATPTVLSDTSDDDVVIDEVKTNAPLCFGLLRTEMIVLRPLGLPADDGFEPAACVLEGRRGDNYSMKINNRQGMFMGWLPFTLTNILGPLIEGRLCWVDAVIPRVRPQHTRSNPIHLIIYGPPRATMTVSDLLLTNHFVLREPAFYNPATRYLNPHAQINRIPGVGPDSSSNLLRTSQQTQRDIKELLSSIPNDTEVDTEALLGRKADIDNTDPNAGSLAAPIDGMTVGLLPHQVKGVAWMLSCERNPNINGGILADDMGLGKTIQSIALILRRKPETEKRRSTLIVSPLALIRQWESEINTKTTPGDLSVHVHHGPNRTMSAEKLASYDIVITTYQVVASEFPVIAHKKKKRRKKVDEEDTNGGDKSSEVVVLDDTEDTTADEGRSEETRSAVMEEYNNAEMQLQYNHDKVFSELPADKGFGPLFGVGWYRVILDEAQQIKNQNTRAAQTTSHLFATKRWCLTGTPLQNNVEELYSLLKFLRVKPWSEYSIFKEQISRPLQSGQGNLAMQRLRVVLKATMLRRTKAVLRGDQSQNVSRANSPTRDAGDVSETTSANPSRLGSPNGDSSTDTPKPDTPEAHTFLNLPERHIEVVETQFSKEERVLYDLLNAKTRKTLAELLRAPKKSERNYLNMLCLLLRLRQACNHPQLVLKALKSETDALELETGQTAKLAAKEQHKEISNRAMMMYVGSGLGWDLSALDPLSAVPPGRCDICLTSLPDASLSMCADCEHKIRKAANVAVKSESANEPTNDTSTHVKPETASEPSNPSPQPAFPLSTKISKLLDILEDTRRQAPTEKTIVFSQFTSMLDLLEGPLGERGFKFCRYDGTMQNNVREKSLAALKKDPSTTVMLISLKCGSLGLNLTAANRVVLMDVWWNPAVEDQAIDRVHRIGQRLPVHVTRLKIMDTVEDKIIQLQEKKRALIQGALGDSDSLRVNKLTMQEIKYLFS
ncbi:hypothetical protein BZG36_03741 [Bifiguratus adelaidae]|uniref:Uncharacterized protein n=1 Tax=Bifiguratus adelaidae TaxID=1938954 RepID=A0A261XY83_9FUNG|nr:hypothetical protein BZG36_03741 [Bifiguratus adelaidae]